MKAFVLRSFGPADRLELMEIDQPVPADDEVLVKAFATTVNSGDTRVRALRVPRGLRLPMRLKLGFTKPKQPILGFEMAGKVEAVGKASIITSQGNSKAQRAGAWSSSDSRNVLLAASPPFI